MDKFLSLYFRFCDLSPSTIDLDDQTTIHFWIPNHRKFNKPNLVMIHGYGGNSRWQFIHQITSLSKSFNLYIPDVIFFGNSYSKLLDRSDRFQARCIVEGLKGFGVDKYNVFGISYGGFVAYRMGEMYPNEVKKVVIVSSGVGCFEEKKGEQLKDIGVEKALDIFVPKNAHDLRLLVKLSFNNDASFKWVPDFFFQGFVNMMYKENRKEKIGLLEYLMYKEADEEPSILTQETLLIWGDNDKVFPVKFAHQLQRNLGEKTRLEILKDTGHAANIEAPFALNNLIKSFVLC
ncbi:hypothetical protein ACFE04_021659 [Oxalis oulophora]